MGKEGQVVPEMTSDWITTISNRYIELYEKVIGEKFVPEAINDEKTIELINKGLAVIL